MNKFRRSITVMTLTAGLLAGSAGVASAAPRQTAPEAQQGVVGGYWICKFVSWC